MRLASISLQVRLIVMLPIFCKCTDGHLPRKAAPPQKTASRSSREAAYLEQAFSIRCSFTCFIIW